MTDIEQVLTDICEAAGLEVQSVARAYAPGATPRWAVLVRPQRMTKRVLLRRLTDEAARLGADYAIDYAAGAPYDEVRFTERAPLPSIPCCDCGTGMSAYMQQGQGYYADRVYVTCENPSCPMCGYTLSADEYPPADLDAYREAGHQRLGATPNEVRS